MQETKLIWKMKKTLHVKQNLTINCMYYNISMCHVELYKVTLEGYIQKAKRRLSLTKKKKNLSEKHESSLFSQQLVVIILTAISQQSDCCLIVICRKDEI